jgi:hypothetical protein
MDQGVIDVADLGGVLVYAAIDHGKTTVRIVSTHHAATPFKLENGAGGNVFFGAMGWQDTKHLGLFAINIQKSLWLTSLGAVRYLLNPADATVAGVVAIPNEMFHKARQMRRISTSERRPCLVTLSRDKKVVSVFNKDHHMDLIRSTIPVTQIRVDPRYGQIAYLTEMGELVVYSLKRKVEVMRVVSGEA